MLTLGRQLAREYENEDYVFISIFSDQRAALYNKVIADTLTPEENKFYVDHYVGQYNKIWAKILKFLFHNWMA